MNATRKTDDLRVANIELFFDLVFVFTLTQQTHLVEHAHAPLEFFRAFMILALIWYIYAGFTWLVSHVGFRALVHSILIAAMGGFLVMALAIPRMFDDTGLVFGLSYLAVILIHLLGLSISGREQARPAVIKLWLINLTTASLVITAPFAQEPWDTVLYLLAVTYPLASRLFSMRGFSHFTFNPGHFVERHGLVMMIALGESILSIGSGASTHDLNAETIGMSILALLLVSSIWWAYFHGGYEKAHESMGSRSAALRENFARLFWWAHLIMIAGIILIAAALKSVLAQQEGELLQPNLMLAAGVAIFYLGNALLRWLVGGCPIAVRIVGAALVLAGGFAAQHWNGIVPLAALLLLIVAILTIESIQASMGEAA